jgi:hypothetical protein
VPTQRAGAPLNTAVLVPLFAVPLVMGVVPFLVRLVRRRR